MRQSATPFIPDSQNKGVPIFPPATLSFTPAKSTPSNPGNPHSTGRANTSKSHNRLLRHVLAAFAEFEREMIASRLAETRAYLKKKYRRLAGKVPFGYDADPVTKQLVMNQSEAQRVRAIFRRAANGQTPSKIAKRIAHLGWRANPPFYGFTQHQCSCRDAAGTGLPCGAVFRAAAGSWP
jgi:hypothetical protein